MNNNLSWKAKIYDINRKIIIDYDVLKYRTPQIKKLKKKCSDINEFSNELKHEMMYYYWSKCEYEIIISVTNNKIILRPYIGDDTVYLDVTDDKSFDWKGFANKHINGQIYTNKAKIDVYDQLQYKWNEFIDYCWYTRLPYERKNHKFER